MVKIPQYICISSLVALAAMIGWMVWLHYYLKSHPTFENWSEDWQLEFGKCAFTKPSTSGIQKGQTPPPPPVRPTISQCLCGVKLMKTMFASPAAMRDADKATITPLLKARCNFPVQDVNDL